MSGNLGADLQLTAQLDEPIEGQPGDEFDWPGSED